VHCVIFLRLFFLVRLSFLGKLKQPFEEKPMTVCVAMLAGLLGFGEKCDTGK
jgi:hypothetical protein